MRAVHAILHVIYHGLFIVGSVIRRIGHAIWMIKPPLFCRDWQTLPPEHHPGSREQGMVVTGGLLGLLIATEIPAASIVPILPRGVVLPPGVSPDGMYPVSIAFGYQHKVRSALAPKFLPGANYLEFAVGVADLRLETPVDGFSGPCAILGRLDLNELLPIILGRILGLQKVLRIANTDVDSFGLRSFWRRSSVSGGLLRRTGDMMRASDCADLAPMMRTFEQPVVSRSMLGSLAFTGFVWHWKDGYAQPAQSTVVIERGLGQGKYVHPATADSSPCSGAWQIRVPWTMRAFQNPSEFNSAAASPRRG
ncbi:MAG TPA: hypothetical protein VFV78_04630 [Vicinamibacterales bacterium]|nr:hypothetical protein [Vicinamibacterales bacterium]